MRKRMNIRRPNKSTDDLNERLKNLVKPDPINAPSYYRPGEPYETILVIEAWDLNFRIGSCISYISRAGRKEDNSKLTDYEKALWFLKREITVLKAAEKETANATPPERT